MANLDRAGNKNFTVEQQPVGQRQCWRALTVRAIKLLLLKVMKTIQRWVWTVCLAFGWLAIAAGAEEMAVVKKDRVNVRAQATPASEVITQLKKGETVTVLEEIAARKHKRGEPATFPVTGVIKGWTEALQMMPVGSKWQLFIPGDLAYGPSGRPGIPSSATLLFDIELIGIEPKAEASGAPSATAPQITPPKANAPAKK